MKYFIISLFLISSVGFIIPQAFSAGENFFYGTTTFEKLPTIIVPNNPAKFEIKFHYTAGSYALDDLTPVIEVNPEGAKSKVHFDVKPISAYQNDIVRIPVTITVDPDLEYEKIFLSISYVGISSSKVSFKSSWSDSIIFDIDHTNSESDGGDIGSSQGIFGPPIIEIPKLLSPLKQFESGVLVDEISCKEDLVLITKVSNGSPVCVKPETKIKLIERGWSSKLETILNSKIPIEILDKKYTLQVNSNIFEIRYSIIGSQLQEITVDHNATSIIVNLENSGKGHLIIELPRKFIDIRNGPDDTFEEDADFFVLVDGSEVDFEESSDPFQRTLTIPFENDSSQIEIILGTFPYP